MIEPLEEPVPGKRRREEALTLALANDEIADVDATDNFFYNDPRGR